jgi:hypothetical protein
MKFKSPIVERTMTLLSQSIAGGIFLPTFLFLAIMQAGSGDAEHTLPETRPFFYILSWPFPLWRYFLPNGAAFLATVVSNIVIYSLLTYWLIRLLSNRKRLP